MTTLQTISRFQTRVAHPLVIKVKAVVKVRVLTINPIKHRWEIYDTLGGVYSRGTSPTKHLAQLAGEQALAAWKAQWN